MEIKKDSPHKAKCVINVDGCKFRISGVIKNRGEWEAFEAACRAFGTVFGNYEKWKTGELSYEKWEAEALSKIEGKKDGN